MSTEYNAAKSQQMQREPKYVNFLSWLTCNGAIFDKVSESFILLNQASNRSNSQPSSVKTCKVSDCGKI